MKRFGVTNRNVLASFVSVANAMGWPTYIERYKLLCKDNNFPKAKHLAEGGLAEHEHFFQVEKKNGTWQVQKVSEKGVHPITPWITTRKFIEALELTAHIVQEKKDQD